MGTRMRDSLKSLVGPRLQDEPVWLRYGMAVALLACVALARAELIPVIGRHSPLLAFVLPVVAACYLCCTSSTTSLGPTRLGGSLTLRSSS